MSCFLSKFGLSVIKVIADKPGDIALCQIYLTASACIASLDLPYFAVCLCLFYSWLVFLLRKGLFWVHGFCFVFFLHGCNLHSVKQFLFPLKSKTAVLYNPRLLQLSVFLCGMAYNLVCCFPCSEVGGSPGKGGECRAFQTVGRMLYH